jgi:hypothetical protein
MHSPLCALLNELNRKVDLIMAAQDDINAAVAAVQQAASDLTSDAAAIQAELAAGSQVDTSQLAPAVSALQASVAAVAALVPPPAQ